MSFWLMGAGVLAIIVVALVVASMATVASARCVAHVFKANRQKRMRFAYGAAAVVSFVGLFIAAAIGLFGVTTLLLNG